MSLEERKKRMAENKVAKQMLAFAQQSTWQKAHEELTSIAKASLSTDDAILHGQIAGALMACGHAVDADCTPEFEWSVLAKKISVDDTLTTFYGTHNISTLDKHLVDDSIADVEASLYEWLLTFTNLKTIMPDGIGFDNEKINLATHLAKMMFDLAKPTQVWKVDMSPTNWYACYWHDFAFENDNLVFMLHLGWSD